MGTAGSRIDVGRLVAVPVLGLMLVAAVTAMISTEAPVRAPGLAVFHRLLVIAFYAVLIWAYLRRTEARASRRTFPAAAWALTGTLLPATIPLVAAAPASPGPTLVGEAITLVGLCWSVYSVRALGPSFSILPQARALVHGGPYRWCRHPLYLGEIVAAGGLIVAHPSWGRLAVWTGLVAAQSLRAVQEERVLEATFPSYAAYRAATPRLLPAPWRIPEAP